MTGWSMAAASMSRCSPSACSGHVAGRRNRLALLEDIRRSLRPDGRLVLGLPNAARRFRAAQAESAALPGLEPGDIRYARATEGGRIALFYHLYRRDEIAEELAAAGFVVERLTAESLLPEYAVTHHAACRLAR